MLTNDLLLISFSSDHFLRHFEEWVRKRMPGKEKEVVVMQKEAKEVKEVPAVLWTKRKHNPKEETRSRYCIENPEIGRGDIN